jgi:hypothetical protein
MFGAPGVKIGEVVGAEIGEEDVTVFLGPGVEAVAGETEAEKTVQGGAIAVSKQDAASAELSESEKFRTAERYFGKIHEHTSWGEYSKGRAGGQERRNRDA